MILFIRFVVSGVFSTWFEVLIFPSLKAIRCPRFLFSFPLFRGSCDSGVIPWLQGLCKHQIYCKNWQPCVYKISPWPSACVPLTLHPLQAPFTAASVAVARTVAPSNNVSRRALVIATQPKLVLGEYFYRDTLGSGRHWAAPSVFRAYFSVFNNWYFKTATPSLRTKRFACQFCAVETNLCRFSKNKK